MEAKFKVGDKCKVVKNLLAPECTGNIVEITKVLMHNGKYYYATLEDGLKGLAAENCLSIISP
jgi:hypothetical protein